MEFLRVRCKYVDHYGYNGRDHHPQERHVGREFLVMKLYVEDPDMILQGQSANPRTVLHPMGDEVPYTVLECVDVQNEEWVTFIGHEVEVV